MSDAWYQLYQSSVWTLIVGTHFYLITCRHFITANDQETSVCCRLTNLLILDLEEYLYTAFTADDNVFMETVGPTSKCVDFEIMTNWEYNSTTIPPILVRVIHAHYYPAHKCL